jgi:hypothetical protein
VLVRLVAEYRRGADTLPPGALIDIDAFEAAPLIEDGRAVPVAADRRAVETRVAASGWE